MPKTPWIQLANGLRIPILFESSALLAIDKPAEWILAPNSWTQTQRNLSLAIQSSIKSHEYWARTRSIKYLRFVHRLDAEVTGIVLFAKNPGPLAKYSELFVKREVEKRYLAVVEGLPKKDEWYSRAPIAPHPMRKGKMKVDREGGKPAETFFKVLERDPERGRTLIEAMPHTGRTHQLRVHLAHAKLPIVGDPLYGRRDPEDDTPPTPKSGLIKKKGHVQWPEMRVALRAVSLRFDDPYGRKGTVIEAPTEEFLQKFFRSDRSDRSDKRR